MNLFSKNKELLLFEYINEKSYLRRFLQFLIGCFSIALAYNVFIAPNNLVPGGVGGIAVICNKLFSWNNSTVILVLNIFLLIISLIVLGKNKTRLTVMGAILFPIMIRATEDINVFLHIDTSHVLLSSLFGGIMYGIGAGLVFKAGFTVGGTDIVNQIISKYFKTSIGKSMLYSDGLIVLSSGIFLGAISMLYSVIIIYIISLMSDKVILGISDNKMFFIITHKDDEVKEYILKTLGHGVTIFKAKSNYKKEEKNVLMTVLPTKDYYKLKEGIKIIDEKAFYIITDSYEVVGGA